MGNHNSETIIGRKLKEEDKFSAEPHYSSGAGAQNTGAKKFESLGRMLMNGVRRDLSQDAAPGNCKDVGPARAPHVEFQDAIGKELRNLFDDIAAQPVPDRFLNLLNQLEDNLLNSTGSQRAPGKSE